MKCVAYFVGQCCLAVFAACKQVIPILGIKGFTAGAGGRQVWCNQEAKFAL